MVRGPEDQFAYEIEKIQFEEGFVEQGSVITKDQDDGTGNEYGPYAYLVSPPSHGREWFYLGKYSKEIDIDERARMDYKRKIFREMEAGPVSDWGVGGLSRVQRRIMKEGLRDDDNVKHFDIYAVKTDHLKRAKQEDNGYKQAWRDTLFSRWSFSYGNHRQRALTKKFLRHIQEEFLELHMDDDQDLVDVDLVFEREDEWGDIPADYDRFKQAVESGEEPTIRN